MSSIIVRKEDRLVDLQHALFAEYYKGNGTTERVDGFIQNGKYYDITGNETCHDYALSHGCSLGKSSGKTFDLGGFYDKSFVTVSRNVKEFDERSL